MKTSGNKHKIIKEKKKIALVLSGGGARGLSHIGVIEEFLAQGYEISSVVGTSIGALIGGVYTLGKLDVFKAWFCSLTRFKVISFLDVSYGKPGLIKGKRVFSKMKTLVEDKCIEELEVPYKAVATDLVNGKSYVFEKGNIFEAIRASVAIPTVFTPVIKDNMVLVDGGVLNNIPMKYCERKDDELLVVVDLGAKIPSQIIPYEEKKESIYDEFIDSMKDKIEKYSTLAKEKYLEKYEAYIGKERVINEEEEIQKKKEIDRGYSDIVQKSISVMMRRLSEISLDQYKPDILISLSYENATTFDFHKATELIALGRDYAKKAITEYENKP